MKVSLRRMVFCLLVSSISLSAYASHLLGAQISIEHVTLNRYKIKLVTLGECISPAVKDTQQIRISSNSLNINFLKTVRKSDSMILYSCTGLPCPNPNADGLLAMIYTDTVTLTVPATDWILSFRRCCRQMTNNINTSNPYIYLETKFDNAQWFDNNTPVDYAFSRRYICLNSPQNLDLSMVDIDGDSLDYQLVAALDSTGVPVNYAPNYSPSNPIASITPAFINTLGFLSVTPSIAGNYLIAYQVREYRNGILLSTTYKDVEVQVVGCSFVPPDFFFTAPLVSGINGSTMDTISSCYDIGFNFIINTLDNDIGDSTKIISLMKPFGSNLSANAAQFQTGTFNWNTSITDTNSEPYLLLVQVADRACGIEYRMFKLYVKNCMGLSLQDFKQELDVRIFPNPTSAVTRLTLNVKRTLNYTITIYDIVGRLIDPKMISGILIPGDQNIEIDLSTQVVGKYLIKIQTEFGSKVIPVQKW